MERALIKHLKCCIASDYWHWDRRLHTFIYLELGSSRENCRLDVNTIE